MAAIKKVQAHCNECGGDKNHDVLHVEKNSWEDGEGMWERIEYKMLKCAGCDSIKLMSSKVSSEDLDYNPVVIYYPPAIFRPHPHWLLDLELNLLGTNSKLPSLIKELYVALHNDQRMLATMGVRAALEWVMIDSVGDKGSFFKNLQSFESEGFISGIQKQRLETILEAGHATIHRMYQPTSLDLIILVDIAEHIIESVYLHDDQVSDLKKKIPIRIKKVNN